MVDSSAATINSVSSLKTDSILKLPYRLYGIRISGSSWCMRPQLLQRSLRIIRMILSPWSFMNTRRRLPITWSAPLQHGQGFCSALLTKKLPCRAFQLTHILLYWPCFLGDVSGASVPAAAHLTEASFPFSYIMVIIHSNSRSGNSISFWAF